VYRATFHKPLTTMKQALRLVRRHFRSPVLVLVVAATLATITGRWIAHDTFDSRTYSDYVGSFLAILALVFVVVACWAMAHGHSRVARGIIVLAALVTALTTVLGIVIAGLDVVAVPFGFFCVEGPECIRAIDHDLNAIPLLLYTSAAFATATVLLIISGTRNAWTQAWR